MFSINYKHRQIIIEHALEEDPNECCGILVGKNGAVEKVRRMTNTVASPYRYDMDPSELMGILDFEYEESGNELVAIYHSLFLSMSNDPLQFFLLLISLRTLRKL